MHYEEWTLVDADGTRRQVRVSFSNRNGHDIAFPDGRTITLSDDEWRVVGMLALSDAARTDGPARDFRNNVARQCLDGLGGVIGEMQKKVAEMHASPLSATACRKTT